MFYKIHLNFVSKSCSGSLQQLIKDWIPCTKCEVVMQNMVKNSGNVEVHTLAIKTIPSHNYSILTKNYHILDHSDSRPLLVTLSEWFYPDSVDTGHFIPGDKRSTITEAHKNVAAWTIILLLAICHAPVILPHVGEHSFITYTKFVQGWPKSGSSDGRNLSSKCAHSHLVRIIIAWHTWHRIYRLMGAGHLV